MQSLHGGRQGSQRLMDLADDVRGDLGAARVASRGNGHVAERVPQLVAAAVERPGDRRRGGRRRGGEVAC